MTGRPNSIIEDFKDKRIVILDFDGVIKDSLECKANAFCGIFNNYPEHILSRIRSHHYQHAGMTRSEKIKCYLEMAGVTAIGVDIESKLTDLSEFMIQSVLNAPWVPGCFEYIKKNPFNQNRYIVSAAPGSELSQIAHRAAIHTDFASIYGYPWTKTSACQHILEQEKCSQDECIYIGDTLVDLIAARECSIDFILRKHRYNREIYTNLGCATINDFNAILPVSA